MDKGNINARSGNLPLSRDSANRNVLGAQLPTKVRTSYCYASSFALYLGKKSFPRALFVHLSPPTQQAPTGLPPPPSQPPTHAAAAGLSRRELNKLDQIERLFQKMEAERKV